MNLFFKEAIKAICNILEDSECRDLKVGLRNLIDYPEEYTTEQLKEKCEKLLECHEYCISGTQMNTIELIIRMSSIVETGYPIDMSYIKSIETLGV